MWTTIESRKHESLANLSEIVLLQSGKVELPIKFHKNENIP